MQTYLVLTATGRDRPGIVDTVTRLIVANDGNVEVSRMARLGGEFALLALVATPEDRAPALVAACAALEREGLVVQARRTEAATATRYAGHVSYRVEVRGADHAGIIHSVAHALAERGVNIETMDTDVTAAPLSGAPLFTMEAIVFAPASIGLTALRAELESIGDELGVDTDVSPHAGF